MEQTFKNSKIFFFFFFLYLQTQSFRHQVWMELCAKYCLFLTILDHM